MITMTREQHEQLLAQMQAERDEERKAAEKKYPIKDTDTPEQKKKMLVAREVAMLDP